MKRIPVHLQIVLAMILGVAWAYAGAKWHFNRFTLDWIAPFGTIFINLLKLIAVPLVLFSVVTGIVGMKDLGALGRLGFKTLGLYLSTTVVAISLGLVLVNAFQPGSRLDPAQRTKNRMAYEQWLEANPQVASADGQRLYPTASPPSADGQPTEQNDKIATKMAEAQQIQSRGPLAFLVDMVPSNIFLSFNDSLMLQVIFFALFFGIALLGLSPETSQPMVAFFRSGDAVFVQMVDVVMKGAPYFVFALMAGNMAELAGDDPSVMTQVFAVLGGYTLVVLAGLCAMLFGVYPLLMRLFDRGFRYTEFFQKVSPAQFLAFSTSSSAATLPVTMEVVHDGLKVPEKVSSFVLPIGATVNMDGTSLYQAVAVVFLAQFHLIELNTAHQLTIVLTAVLASIGTAAVPGAGLIMLLIVLESVGLNPAWIAIILPVDRILDMCRTVVNVTGDMAVSKVVAVSEPQLTDA
ncbi:cation:dicarboxylase symporter family transporter [bacterium]|nr:cation:dicarboxylase symporter family transporter [bacterium]